MKEIPIYKLNFFLDAYRHSEGGAGRAPLCDQFHSDWDAPRKRPWICTFVAFEHPKILGLTSVPGFERMSGFRINVTFVFVHEAPGFSHHGWCKAWFNLAFIFLKSKAYSFIKLLDMKCKSCHSMSKFEQCKCNHDQECVVVSNYTHDIKCSMYPSYR